MFCAHFPGRCAGCREPFGAGEEVIYDETGQLVTIACGCGLDLVSDDEAAEIMARGDE
jgi:hypothetical protein